jgi:hypothetical protein
VSEDDKGRILRLALNDALHSGMPKLDTFLRHRQPKATPSATVDPTPAPSPAPAPAPAPTPPAPTPVATPAPAPATPASSPAVSTGKKFCAECGTPNALDAKFCMKCGHKLD